MTQLPKWVWDLVIHLQQMEEEHPSLFRQMDAKYPEQGYSYVPSDWCPGNALKQVPRPIRRQAEAIRDYTRQAEQDKEEDLDEPGR